MVGVSSDSVLRHDAWSQHESLPFTLLSDPDDSLRRILGVKNSLLGLLPPRVTFVIGQDGRVHGRYSAQLWIPRHVSTALQTLEAMRAEASLPEPVREDLPSAQRAS